MSNLRNIWKSRHIDAGKVEEGKEVEIFFEIEEKGLMEYKGHRISCLCQDVEVVDNGVKLKVKSSKLPPYKDSRSMMGTIGYIYKDKLEDELSFSMIVTRKR